jgi:Flp pilus assembly protein TadD
MLSLAISRVFLSLILLAFIASGVSASDANKVKTPQEGFKGGTGLYLAQQGFDEIKKGNNEEAIKLLKKAIQYKPNYAEAHEGLGRAQGNLKHWPEAVASFKKAISLNPDFIQAHMGLGFSYGILNRNQEALKAFKEAARLNPRLSHAHWGLGTTYLALGDRNAAVREHKIMKTLDPAMAKRFEKYLK